MCRILYRNQPHVSRNILNFNGHSDENNVLKNLEVRDEHSTNAADLCRLRLIIFIPLALFRWRSS